MRSWAAGATSAVIWPTRPNRLRRRALHARLIERCVVAAADVVDAAPNDEDASNKLLRCARALSQAAADLHPVDGEDAPSTAAAARVMKDAGGFI